MDLVFARTATGDAPPVGGHSPLSAIAWWVLYSAFCSATGWVLSAVHQLNAAGYAVAFGLGMALLVTFRRLVWPPVGTARRSRLATLKRRFRRSFPMAFAVLATMALLGGVLYHPGNPDGLTQRIPRVLAWLAEGRWHWLENSATSFNSHACGFEWLMAPMFVFLRTDRWVFLYNVAGYLLLPSLVFSTLRRLGVQPRVAWHWMWVTPAGLCFVMQAGSIANDMAGAVLALAAVDFALRANASRRFSDFCLSFLAAALLSNMKTSNLPLGLAWLVAIWPSLRWLCRRPVASILLCLVAAGVSLLPTIGLNLAHGTSWCGDYGTGTDHRDPGVVLAVIGTVMNVIVGNFVPSIFPVAGWWNDHIYKLLPTALLAKMELCFEPGAAHLTAKELQFEICAGISFALSWLVVISSVWRLFGHRQKLPVSAKAHTETRARAPISSRRHLMLVRWCPYIGLLVFMSKMVVSGSTRLMTPYYCLLLPALLVGPGQAALVRRRWWRVAALAVFAVAALMLVLNPPRPLWPAKTILSRLSSSHPSSKALTQGRMMYEAYSDRWDALATIRNRIPPEGRNVGFITFLTGSSMETSLWRPFGSRRVWRLLRETERAELDRRGIEYVVIATDSLAKDPAQDFQGWFERWLGAVGGSVVAQVGITVLATSEPMPWYLVRIEPAHR